MRGDVLASGGRSATFGPAKVSQDKWDAIFKEDKPIQEIPLETKKEPKE